MNFFQIKNYNNMETSINEDFKKLISKIKFFYSIKQSDIAFGIGVKSTYLSDMINGRVPVTDSVIEKLYELYSDIKQETEKFQESEISKENKHTAEIMIPKDGLKAPIPYYNVDFAGGWESEEIFSIGNPDFYINNPEFDRAKFACNLVGHSISRRIPNRSIIGLKLIEDWQTYFPTNELYGVVMKNELRTVKIVKRSKENKNLLILIPDPLPEHNQIQFETEEVPIEFVSKFYQIVAWAQFERIAQ